MSLPSTNELLGEDLVARSRHVPGHLWNSLEQEVNGVHGHQRDPNESFGEVLECTPPSCIYSAGQMHVILRTPTVNSLCCRIRCAIRLSLLLLSAESKRSLPTVECLHYSLIKPCCLTRGQIWWLSTVNKRRRIWDTVGLCTQHGQRKKLPFG